MTIDIEKIERYYSIGIYHAVHIQHMVECGALTSEQYQAITGEEYVPE